MTFVTWPIRRGRGIELFPITDGAVARRNEFWIVPNTVNKYRNGNTAVECSRARSGRESNHWSSKQESGILPREYVLKKLMNTQDNSIRNKKIFYHLPVP
jgi:hypothetical protein